MVAVSQASIRQSQKAGLSASVCGPILRRLTRHIHSTIAGPVFPVHSQHAPDDHRHHPNVEQQVGATTGTRLPRDKRNAGEQAHPGNNTDPVDAFHVQDSTRPQTRKPPALAVVLDIIRRSVRVDDFSIEMSAGFFAS
jgi:hypothetical protein